MFVPRDSSIHHSVRTAIEQIVDAVVSLERRVAVLGAGGTASAQDIDEIRKEIAKLKKIPNTLDFNDVFRGSGPAHSIGYVPDPGETPGTTRFLREDGTWAVP